MGGGSRTRVKKGRSKALTPEYALLSGLQSNPDKQSDHSLGLTLLHYPHTCMHARTHACDTEEVRQCLSEHVAESFHTTQIWCTSLREVEGGGGVTSGGGKYLRDKKKGVGIERVDV